VLENQILNSEGATAILWKNQRTFGPLEHPHNAILQRRPRIPLHSDLPPMETRVGMNVILNRQNSIWSTSVSLVHGVALIRFDLISTISIAWPINVNFVLRSLLATSDCDPARCHFLRFVPKTCFSRWH
jgi:hypothetical protein